MGSTYAHIIENQREHSKRFGAMLRRWRELNGWTQYTAEDWSREAGFIQYGHGSTSELENGKNGNPGPKCFLHLYEVNRRLAAEDYSGVTSRKLKDLLVGSRPILDEFGDPWTAGHWWGVHKGLHPIPDWLDTTAAPSLTDEQAADLCAHWIDGLRELVRGGVATASQMSQAYLAAPVDRQERWHEVLLGLRPYSPDELGQLWDSKAEDWLPVLWIKAWAELVQPTPIGGGGGQVGIPT
jgi:transcriptional regulator with XRE-family HTH domain